MRLRRSVIACIAVLAMSGVVSTQGRNTAEARLRAAMDKETVDGDLTAAAEGYKQVVSDSGANRAVVAQALLRLGMAYEKQGSQEANGSYQRIVREFVDQPAVVQLAKARMAAAGVAGPTLRQVCVWECGGTLSPDGRWLLVANNGLGLRELGSIDKVRNIVPEPNGGVIRSGRFSPDGRRIVYTIEALPLPGTADPNGQIVVVDADGRNVRMIPTRGISKGWSADGRRILAITNGNKPVWVTVATGTVQPVSTSAWENIDVFVVSPDGQSVAFSGNRNASEAENVFVIGADASGETRIAPNPTYQEPFGWSPDSKYLLYGQFGESTTLWAVRMSNGHAQGPPILVRRFDGRIAVLGITRSGALLYRTQSSSGEPYTAAMDPVSGKVTSVPAVVPTSTPGAPMAWSPDSRRIAYLAGPSLQRELHVFSLADGRDRRVPARVSFVNSLCWVPGSEAVLTNTMTESGPRRFDTVRVDLDTGESRPVFPGAPSFRLWNCTDTLATSIDETAVKVRNLQTGTEKELHQINRPVPNYGMSKLSRDGRMIAFLERPDVDTSVLMVVPSSGGAARELTRATAPVELQQIDGHAWSPDSRYIYFFKRANSRAPHQLYRVSVAGGTEEKMGLEGMELRGLEIAPDGRKAFFVIGAINRPEVWALENFLPAAR